MLKFFGKPSELMAFLSGLGEVYEKEKSLITKKECKK